MKIALLIMHILCAILWAVAAHLTPDKVGKILYTICSICWSICVVLDIIQLV